MSSTAMLARKFDLPVVPIHIRARNSALFYLFDAIHPTLRDITLFHETLNKARQPFRIRVGTADPGETHLSRRSRDRHCPAARMRPWRWPAMRAMACPWPGPLAGLSPHDTSGLPLWRHNAARMAG